MASNRDIFDIVNDLRACVRAKIQSVRLPAQEYETYMRCLNNGMNPVKGIEVLPPREDE